MDSRIYLSKFRLPYSLFPAVMSALAEITSVTPIRIQS